MAKKLFQTYIYSVVHVHVPLKLQTGVIFFPTDITVKVFVIVTACSLIDDDNFFTTFNIVLDKTQSMMRPVVVRDQLDCPTVLCFSENKQKNPVYKIINDCIQDKSFFKPAVLQGDAMAYSMTPEDVSAVKCHV